MALFRAGQENKRARETGLVFAGKNPERLQRCCRLCSWPAAAKAREPRGQLLSLFKIQARKLSRNKNKQTRTQKGRDEKETQRSGLA